MAKTVTATEAKNKLGQILDMAVRDEPVIISNYGRPSSVIISYDEYEEYKTYRQIRREEAWAKLERLRKKVSSRNRDMSEADIEKFAQKVRDDVLDSIVKKNQNKFVK